MRRSNVSYRRFTDEEIAKADRVDLVRLAEQYGFQTEKGGRNAIHLKKSGGLYIFPNENRFYHHTADVCFDVGFHLKEHYRCVNNKEKNP